MRYILQTRRGWLVGAGLGLALVTSIGSHVVTAQSASGTVTGRVMWGPCVRGIPLPMSPSAPDGSSPTQSGQAPGPDSQMPGRMASGLPAGAVLVAVQNTSLSARTDETGRFTISGVPAGQYLTVAAGPVANSASAIAERPNVFVSNGGDRVDIGTLMLGGSGPVGLPCRIVPGMGGAIGPDTQPSSPDQPDAP